MFVGRRCGLCRNDIEPTWKLWRRGVSRWMKHTSEFEERHREGI
jgi:hypothetical protein